MAEEDSKGTRSPARRSAGIGSAIDKLAEARFLIEEDAATSADAIAYVHAVLCQISLPRSAQKQRVWTRSNGGASLTVVAGGLFDHQKGERIEQPLPQGPYARLILADISTYAVRHKTPLVPMEDSVSAYMRNRLKLIVNGGKRGTYTSFKREAMALAASYMELSIRYAGGNRQVQSKAPPIEEFAAWTVGPEVQNLWPCELRLSGRFYESLRAHAAPIDMRAYRALAHSAFAQDIYTWLAHRLPRLRSPLGLPWAVLAEQFGGYASIKEFRKEFVRRLHEVITVYPDARLEVVNGRRGELGGSLLLKPSPAPVYPIAEVVPAAIGAKAAMKTEESPSEIRALLREDLPAD